MRIQIHNGARKSHDVAKYRIRSARADTVGESLRIPHSAFRVFLHRAKIARQQRPSFLLITPLLAETNRPGSERGQVPPRA